MDVLERINEIMKRQNITDYQLAKLSGLASSTISNMRRRNTIPSIPTLENICDSLNISLMQFFADENTLMYPVTPRQREFLDYYVQLSDEQQNLLFELTLNMKPHHSRENEK